MTTKHNDLIFSGSAHLSTSARRPASERPAIREITPATAAARLLGLCLPGIAEWVPGRTTPEQEQAARDIAAAFGVTR